MTKIVRVETYKRSIFGKLIKFLFILFNILMIVWLVAALGSLGDGYSNLTNEAERAGHAVGSVIGLSMIATIWVFGDIILGLFVLLTRGKKFITEEVN